MVCRQKGEVNVMQESHPTCYTSCSAETANNVVGRDGKMARWQDGNARNAMQTKRNETKQNETK